MAIYNILCGTKDNKLLLVLWFSFSSSCAWSNSQFTGDHTIHTSVASKANCLIGLMACGLA